VVLQEDGVVHGLEYVQYEGEHILRNGADYGLALYRTGRRFKRRGERWRKLLEGREMGVLVEEFKNLRVEWEIERRKTEGRRGLSFELVG
jgi:hypothetical protein